MKSFGVSGIEGEMWTEKFVCWLVFCFLQACCLPLWAGPSNAPDAIEIRLQAQTIYPGDVVRMSLKVSANITKIEGSLAGRPILFYPGEAGWEGLVGIDLETEPGTYTLEGKASTSSHEATSFRKTVRVRPKKFPVQHITVKERYATPNPEDARRAVEEARRMEEIWKTATPKKLWNGSFLKPVNSQLTSGFGRRRVVNKQPRSPHSGVDLKASTGTPIRATNAGKVVLAEELFYPGNTIILDHGLGLYTLYAHCSTIQVQEGEFVERGQVVGKVGATGRVTGPHLHWACRLGEARVNPLELITAFAPEEPAK